MKERMAALRSKGLGKVVGVGVLLLDGDMVDVLLVLGLKNSLGGNGESGR